MWLHLGLLAVCTWVLPFCMGMLPVRYMKEEHKSFGMVWLSGWMMMFAVFEVLVVPFIVREASFSMAIQCYTVVIGILAVLFLFLGRSTVPACLRKWKEARPDWGQAMIMFLVLTLIILQLIFAFSYAVSGRGRRFFCGHLPYEPAYGYHVPVYTVLWSEWRSGHQTCPFPGTDFYGMALRSQRHSCHNHMP